MVKQQKHFATVKGIERLKEKIAEMKENLKKIQEEKSHAYSASGDGWHDNPGWLQLGQQEEQLSADIVRLESKLMNAVLFKKDAGSDKVSIGSLVKYKMEPLGKPGRITEMTVEIVGSGESNIREKLVSYDSPIGMALYNMPSGAGKKVELPNGLFMITVLTINNSYGE